VDQLVRDAVERRLERREWRDLLAFGEKHAKSRRLTEKHAKSRRLTEADVPQAIVEIRRPSKERER
jgi:hypothetical protein